MLIIIQQAPRSVSILVPAPLNQSLRAWVVVTKEASRSHVFNSL